MGKLIGAALGMLMGAVGVVHAAPTYIESPALDKVLNTSVGEVNSGVTQVPLITWGADIRTIHANGNGRSTARGSIFDQLGLTLKLVREDSFAKQAENYLSGRTPYLRGTLGMINMVTDALSKDPRTAPVVIYQLSESAGGDALVVKPGIHSARELKGKTIALQAYGPHVDYLAKLLTDAGLSFSDVRLRWLADLTATENSPMAAFYEKGIDAAMVIIPDALALTSGGNVGTGSEQSVRGASILLSTKTANRIIADVYAVRADYLSAHREEVKKFVRGLMLGQDAVDELMANRVSRSVEHTQLMRAAAGILLDAEEAVSDTEALYADAEHIDYAGNVKFFTDRNYPRNMQRRSQEIQRSFSSIGLTTGRVTPTFADWDYATLKSGLSSTNKAQAPMFNQQKVVSVVAKRQQQGTLGEGELFSFEVFFQPNQNSFSAEFYQEAFDKVIELASTYGGALITIEGHSDPLGYLRQKKSGEAPVVLSRIRQSAKNLSLTRANAVRDSIIEHAKNRHITMDESQITAIGHGIGAPKTGICGTDPCAPKTAQEWHDNMRVVFRILQIEAEAEVFSPL